MQASASPRPFLVVLDPGHGGADTGALVSSGSGHMREKDLTLAIAKKTFRELRRLGIPAILTRYEDANLSLDDRAQIANRSKAAAFVSIHINSSNENRSTGAETYVFKAATNEASRRLADLENGKSRVHKPGGADFVELIKDDLATTGNYASSVQLADAIQKRAATSAKTRDRGTKQALFYVLMKIQMPGILFEPGFLSNKAESAKLKDAAFQKSIAKSLALGIANWKFTTARRALAGNPPAPSASGLRIKSKRASAK